MANRDRTSTEQKRELNTVEMTVQLLGMIAVKGLPQTQQISILNRVGFTPKLIANVLGTTANTVRVALFGIRKAEKMGKRKSFHGKEQKDEKGKK